MSKLNDKLRKKSTTKTPTKSTSKIPVLEVPAKVSAAVDQVLAGKREKTDAEAKISTNERVILTHVSEERDERAYNGSFSKSYKVPGSNDSMITVVYSNAASINSTDEEILKELVGGEKAFEQLFESTTKVELKGEIFGNETEEEAFLTALENKAVEKFFDRFFNLSDVVKLKPDFDQNIFKFVNKSSLETIRTFVKMKKASIK